jgi:protocatechuate 3,4-dioxygenase beta subunit
MLVAGRVLDPDGRPLPNARVAVLADRKRQVGDIDGRHRNILMGTAAADADGRFALVFPAIPPPRLEHLSLIAVAPGRVLTAVDLKTDVERQETSITLAAEEPVEGRLVDVQGQPAAGVVVRLAKLILGRERQPSDAKGAPNLWPPPATTDSGGRFRMLGLRQDTPATFEVEDTRYARGSFAFGTHAPSDVFRFRAAGEGGGVLRPGSTVTLRPVQVLEIRVVHADDGAPVAGARVDIQSQLSEQHYPMDDIAQARTDGQGRAQVIPGPGIAYRLHIYPPEGEPYVPALREIEWPKAAVRQSVDVKLSRGAVVRGRLIEDPAGTPVVGGWAVYHQTFRNNPRFRYLPSIEAVSGPDGTFTMVVPYGPGHLLVQGPSADYLHVTTSPNEMGIGADFGLHMYPDAHASLEIKDGQATHPLELRLRRGVTITGRVLTPDGRPVAEAFAIGRSYAPYQEGHDPLTPFRGDAPRIEVKDGRFEIPGCDPEKLSTFYFLDLKDKLGATVQLSGQSAAAGPVTVRLQPTASARIRLTGADGRPLANCDAGQGFNDLRLVITPGPDFAAIQDNADLTIGDFEYHVNLDLVRQSGLRSGADGRATISSLIPGAPYRFHGRDFRAKSGQTVALGDVVIAKPPR